jgi:long-chain fatty acid transport protein
MPNRSRRVVTLAMAAFSLTLLPAPTQAAGFAIFEQGAKSMGFGGAFVAQANDPSAIFHNAAGIAFLKGNQIHLGGTAIAPKTDFTGADPYPGAGITEKGDAGVTIPPVADFTHQVSESLVVGLGFHVPYGLKTQWSNPSNYTGRFISKSAELQGFAIIPTVGYKLADRLAVGAGLDIRFASVTLMRNVPAVNPYTLKVVDVASVEMTSDTNTGIGFNLGLLAKPTESLSIGIAYRHKVKVDFTGQAAFTRIPTGSADFDSLVSVSLPTGREPLTTSIEFPALAAFGIAYAMGDWTIEGDLDWYQWSTFKSLDITFENRPDLSGRVPENYENSTQYRIGLERRIGDSFEVRGGYFYDKSPAPTASVGPLLPDADRHGAALGFSYKKGSFRTDVAYWHLFFKERSTAGQNRDSYDGTYQSSGDLFALSIGYGF